MTPFRSRAKRRCEYVAIIRELPGAVELHDWFGYWPDFHDAEILTLLLHRCGSLALRVHSWDTTKEVDDHGHYVQRKHVVVEFEFQNVNELNLTGFNSQNVVSSLVINKIDSGFRVELGACYGLAGHIEAEKISIRITPGHPAPA